MTAKQCLALRHGDRVVVDGKEYEVGIVGTYINPLTGAPTAGVILCGYAHSCYVGHNCIESRIIDYFYPSISSTWKIEKWGYNEYLMDRRNIILQLR